MVTTMILKLAIFMISLSLAPAAKCQFLPPPWDPPPLCVSQIALANHACEKIPFTPVPPPSPLLPPPSPPLPPSPIVPTPPCGDEHTSCGDEHMHRHHHGHKHRHRHNSQATPVEENCCRWLNEVDNVCVCDILLHLSPFLAKPAHSYTVAVGDACVVTYQCPGRLGA